MSRGRLRLIFTLGGLGAAVAPLVGIAGSGTALPMAVMIATLELAALAALLILAGSPNVTAIFRARTRLHSEPRPSTLG